MGKWDAAGESKCCEHKERPRIVNHPLLKLYQNQSDSSSRHSQKWWRKSPQWCHQQIIFSHSQCIPCIITSGARSMAFSNAAHVTKVGPWIVTGEAAPGCAAMKVFSSVTAMFRPTYPHTPQLWPLISYKLVLNWIIHSINGVISTNNW